MEHYIKSIGQIIGDREQFQINGATYPSGWLSSASSDELKSIQALPIEDVYPELTIGEVYGEPTISIKSTKVVRTHTVRDMTEDELGFEKSKANAPILQQIEELERQQIRPQGEILAALLSGTTPNEFAVTKHQQIEDAKATLRAQLL